MTNQGQPVTINVLANDQNISASSVALSSAPGNGNAQLEGTSFVYEPAADFFGTDSFVYSVASADGSSLTATVSIAVNAAPIAGDVAVEADQNVTTTLDLLSATVDPDGNLDGASIEILSVGIGSAEAGADGVVTYLSAEDFAGTDTITFSVTDSQGAASGEAIATVSVNLITNTRLLVRELALPTTGYVFQNNPELGGTLLSSPAQDLLASANGVSLLLT